MRLNWPQEFHELLNRLSFLNFNVELASPECLVTDESVNFSFKLKLSLAVPLVAFALLWTMAAIKKITQIVVDRYRNSPSNKPKTIKSTDGVFLSAVHAFNAILRISFVLVVSKSIALFDCTAENDGVIYLDADPSLRCYDDWWRNDLVYGILGICFYVIGIPLYFSTILYIAYRKKSGTNSGNSSRITMFCVNLMELEHGLKPGYQYFDIIQLIQKLFIVVISSFFTRYVGLQIVLTLAVLLSHLLLTVIFRPHIHQALNTFESMSSICAMAVLALGLPFHIDVFRSSNYQYILIAVIITLVIGFVISVVIFALWELYLSVMKHRGKLKDYLAPRSRQSTRI
ncbi:hypothetical protein BKA69DRAFT_186136 [Paraphysoderma sedebokerense]|nr:hypothetical protein BKA69DRAFT_186136 [Paraphysoderma sedebokerense]